MSRRSSKNSRRFGESGGIGALFGFNSLSRSSPYFPIALILLGAVFLFVYLYSSSAQFGGNRQALNRVSRVHWRFLSANNPVFTMVTVIAVCDFPCTVEVREAIPILKKAYGDSMHKVLHIGPNTCYVVSRLLKEEETEAWGVEPYDIEDADGNCKALVRRGIVRVADIKFPLPYRPKSFSLVIVSDAVDYLSPKYLNKTIPDLARVSAHGLVIFTGLPGQHRAKVAEVTKFGRAAKLRSSSWWVRFFLQTSLEENEAAIKKFQQAATKSSYHPNCQIFHLKSFS
ncbi:PECTIN METHYLESTERASE CGR3-RELATED [Salix viminalis]|uniref:PECTIN METHYLESTERASE CGR3-RELATED n=1 Tax=Salix viminalis TaxID=40686 RepID=A0A9Q0ZD45_SALVM|nr:PECTIN METHYLESTERASE CGR3-RELATED [Salix viminalis]